MLGGGEAESVRGGRVEVLDSVTKLSLLRVSAALSKCALLREPWKLSGQGTGSLKIEQLFSSRIAFYY